MEKVKALLLLTVCFGLMGTTFVIKEGGREVGRYDESDGKKEIVTLENNVPKPAVKRAPAPALKTASKPAAPGLQGVSRELAEKMVQEVKQKNDARKAEVEAAIKEMEEH